MKNSFKAIIFDLDGTLVDSEGIWHQAEEDLVEARGHEYTLDARSHLIGLRLDEALGKLKAYYNFSDDVPTLVRELDERMLKLIAKGVQPKPGAHEMVQWVIEQNIPHAIASASPQSIIDALVDSQGWLPHFPIRRTCDDEAAGKPAPDVYLTTARILGFDPSECLAIEDTHTGARAAAAAGMITVAVPDRYANRALFPSITPHVYESLDEVLKILR
ncbi:MAG: HAD family phosphatase [Chloroflexota bacterium]|nr:HAD family phosphatase [Chloroflexota bacterium]